MLKDRPDGVPVMASFLGSDGESGIEVDEAQRYQLRQICRRQQRLGNVFLSGSIKENVLMTGDFERTFDKYVELYKNGGYIREMRKHVGHAPILTCACGVIIENSLGEILLQKRRDNGCWAIIGGSMELGETFEETVRRETREESGLLLGKLELFQLYSGRDRIIEYPNGDVCFGPGIVFITREYKGTIVNDPEEVLEHRFFKKSELPENLNQYDKDIIRN